MVELNWSTKWKSLGNRVGIRWKYCLCLERCDRRNIEKVLNFSLDLLSNFFLIQIWSSLEIFNAVGLGWIWSNLIFVWRWFGIVRCPLYRIWLNSIEFDLRLALVWHGWMSALSDLMLEGIGLDIVGWNLIRHWKYEGFTIGWKYRNRAEE